MIVFFSCQDQSEFGIEIKGWFCVARCLFDLVTGVAKAIGHILQSFFSIEYQYSASSQTRGDRLANVSNICQAVHIMMADYSMLPGFSASVYNSLFVNSSPQLGPEEFD